MTRPYYLIHERLLRNNLAKIAGVAREAEAEIILAFKAYALWRTFPVFREYIGATTASSPFEARLAVEEFGEKAHTFSPAYEEDTFPEVVRCSSHISFNSLSQFHRFAPAARAKGVSCGLRINPEYSEINTPLYNPCSPLSRFGVTADGLTKEGLPQGVEGFHCHNHCESNSYAFERSMTRVEERFAPWIDSLRWINFGGGHLMTRKGYDCQHLVKTLRDFRQRHPHLAVVLEPGSAFGWQTGELVSHVVDIVATKGIRTAILDVSFTCHMPDCLEMPYLPNVRGAETLAPEETTSEVTALPTVYRLGGNSCLSGDSMGYWQFPRPLAVGQEIVFEDMGHYTTVKTTMFNGIAHPDIIVESLDGSRHLLRRFTYADYRDRMD